MNSDLYVFQMVGNSWRYGYWPYRDVYDVKGPFLYLLFGLFAWLRPWSMLPPLVFLAVLASCSVGLGYRIARLLRLSRPLAVLSAVASCLVIYLGVADLNSSFTCEEIAVPGVLLMLWLVLRLLHSPEAGGRGLPVPAGWWVVNGMVFGALFWTKYQVIAPWAAVFLGLVVATAAGRLSPRSLGRLAGWNAVGVVVASALVLGWFQPVWSEMAQAYFLGKRGSIQLDTELPAQGAWFIRTVTENTGASLVLLTVLAVFVAAALRKHRTVGLVLGIGLLLSMWASAAFVRHPNNLFMPLSFTAAALPLVLAAAAARRRVWIHIAAAATVIASVLVIAGPLIEAQQKMWLFGQPKRMTCHDLRNATSTTRREQISTVFASASDHRPIMSIGTLFAARTSFISRQPMRHPFEFVDHSWAATIGATDVQTRYLNERTFEFVWIHTDALDRLRSLSRPVVAADLHAPGIRREQAAALAANYVPILGCNRELLLRATQPVR